MRHARDLLSGLRACVLFFVSLSVGGVALATGEPSNSSMLTVDYESLISQADLIFDKQVSASYLGMRNADRQRPHLAA